MMWVYIYIYIYTHVRVAMGIERLAGEQAHPG